jgi:predicted nucleotide-binding protein (sugar kinase/HSP70/actin superfamily)
LIPSNIFRALVNNKKQIIVNKIEKSFKKKVVSIKENLNEKILIFEFNKSAIKTTKPKIKILIKGEILYLSSYKPVI